MPLQVAVTQPDGMTVEYVLYEGRKYQVGRSAKADIVIPHAQVSRLHANLVSTTDSDWKLQNTSSTGCFTNGNLLNKLDIDSPVTVHLGPVACRFSPLTTDNLIRLESQKVWRDKQLHYRASTFQQCQDSQALLQMARECLQQCLGCERAAVLLVDKQGALVQSIGYDNWLAHDSFSGSRTFMQTCATQRQALSVGNLSNDSQFSQQQSVVRFGIKAAIAVPLIVADNVLGVLYADSVEDRLYFSQTDIAFVAELGNLLSLRLLYLNIEQRINSITRQHTTKPLAIGASA